MTQIQLATGSAQGVNAYAPATPYTAGQQVLYLGQLYYAQPNFTSGASFAADGANWGQAPPSVVTVGSLGTTLGTSALSGGVLGTTFAAVWGIPATGPPYYRATGPTPGGTPAVLRINSSGQPVIVGVHGAF